MSYAYTEIEKSASVIYTYYLNRKLHVQGGAFKFRYTLADCPTMDYFHLQFLGPQESQLFLK